MSDASLPEPHLWEYSAFPVRVARKQQLTPGFIRVTLAGRALSHFAPWGLDQRIKLILPMADGSAPDFGLLANPTPHPKDWYSRWKALPEAERNALRTYTPSGIRPDQEEIDVDLFIHEPAGPASAWAIGCQTGDELVITGPDVRVGFTGYGIHYVPDAPPSRVLLIGDESALPAIRNIIDALPDGVQADVLIELASRADSALAPEHPRVATEVVDRGSRAGEQLASAVHRWTTAHDALRGDPGIYAWIAGEAAATTSIRRHLTTDFGLAKEQVAFLGYWRLGGPLVG
ncbi:siderophore-interacting protein [Microbacterium sp. GXF0217]